MRTIEKRLAELEKQRRQRLGRGFQAVVNVADLDEAEAERQIAVVEQAAEASGYHGQIIIIDR